MIYGNVWALTMGLLIPNEIALWFANVEYEIREVEDSRYGSVKAYHSDVIRSPANAARLREAIQAADTGKAIPHELED